MVEHGRTSGRGGTWEVWDLFPERLMMMMMMMENLIINSYNCKAFTLDLDTVGMDPCILSLYICGRGRDGVSKHPAIPGFR